MAQGLAKSFNPRAPSAGSSEGPRDPSKDLAAPASSLREKLTLALRRSPIALNVQRLIPLAPGILMRRYEVLLRSQARGAPNSAPTAMLQAALDNGLGAVIDRGVVRRLSQWLARYPDVWACERAFFSVNLAASTAYDLEFVEFVRSILQASSIPAPVVGFELDAARITTTCKSLVDVAESFAQMGCSLVLDNFTPTEEGIDLLHLAGVRQLKLAPAVTADIRHTTGRLSVSSTCEMAKSLGIQTVAKCTQGSQDRSSFAALGIDFVQSHGLFAPIPIDSLIE